MNLFFFCFSECSLCVRCTSQIRFLLAVSLLAVSLLAVSLLACRYIRCKQSLCFHRIYRVHSIYISIRISYFPNKNTFLAINQWIEWAITRSIREGFVPRLFEDFAILLLIQLTHTPYGHNKMNRIIWWKLNKLLSLVITSGQNHFIFEVFKHTVSSWNY